MCRKVGAIWGSAWSGPGGVAVAGGSFFFGADSPDIPADALAAIPQALLTHDVAIGPVVDGGYWTLATRQFHRDLFQGIDWGSKSVYHQTCIAAERAGLSVAPLMRWHDVDNAIDLTDLRQRLTRAGDPPLCALRDRLNVVCRNNP